MVRMNVKQLNPSIGRTQKTDSIYLFLNPEGSVMVPCPICEEIMETRHINQHLDSGCVWTPKHINASAKLKNSKHNSGESQAKAWASVFSSAGSSKSKLVNCRLNFSFTNFTPID